MRLFLLDPRGFLERGQGVLLLLEGSLYVLEGHDLFLEGFALFLESPGERGDSRPLTLELSLLALELGLLRFEGLLLLLERRSGLPQLGLTCLGLLGLLVSYSSLRIALTVGLGQPALQPAWANSEFGGRSPSLTSPSRTASVAEDFSHGSGSSYCAIAPDQRGTRGAGSDEGKGALTLLFFFLTLLGSELWAKGRRRR